MPARLADSPITTISTTTSTTTGTTTSEFTPRIRAMVSQPEPPIRCSSVRLGPVQHDDAADLLHLVSHESITELIGDCGTLFLVQLR